MRWIKQIVRKMIISLLRVPVAYFYYCLFDIEADLPGDSMIKLSIRLLFIYLLAAPRGMWAVISPIRDQTLALCIGSEES